MKTKRAGWVLLAAAAILSFGLVSCATRAEKEAKLQTEAKVSRTEAEKIALARVPGGMVKEAELEKEHGKLIWSFDIGSSGTPDITEVHVDALTGNIVGMEKESVAQESNEMKGGKR